MIRIFSGLRQHIDNQLTYGTRSLNAFDFRVVRFGNDRVKPLIVEIYEDGLSPLQDAIDRAVMQVQESKRPTMTRFAFDIGHVKHVREIQNVGVEVSAIEAISYVAGQIC